MSLNIHYEQINMIYDITAQINTKTTQISAQQAWDLYYQIKKYLNSNI